MQQQQKKQKIIPYNACETLNFLPGNYLSLIDVFWDMSKQGKIRAMSAFFIKINLFEPKLFDNIKNASFLKSLSNRSS